MNKKEALALLGENLEKYIQNGFLFHRRFLEEFKTLLKNASGNEKEIFALFVKQMNFVRTLGKQVNNADGNEIIKHQEKEFYSLHLSGKNFNFRFLMTFVENNPVFLCAFYEREGKRVSDYTKWKEVLVQRLNEILEEID